MLDLETKLEKRALFFNFNAMYHSLDCINLKKKEIELLIQW